MASIVRSMLLAPASMRIAGSFAIVLLITLFSFVYSAAAPNVVAYQDWREERSIHAAWLTITYADVTDAGPACEKAISDAKVAMAPIAAELRKSDGLFVIWNLDELVELDNNPSPARERELRAAAEQASQDADLYFQYLEKGRAILAEFAQKKCSVPDLSPPIDQLRLPYTVSPFRFVSDGVIGLSVAFKNFLSLFVLLLLVTDVFPRIYLYPHEGWKRLILVTSAFVGSGVAIYGYASGSPHFPGNLILGLISSAGTLVAILYGRQLWLWVGEGFTSASSQRRAPSMPVKPATSMASSPPDSLVSGSSIMSEEEGFNIAARQRSDDISAKTQLKPVSKKKKQKPNYIQKHWRGELSLAASFWINVCLINIAVGIFQGFAMPAPPIDNPVFASKIAIVLVFVLVAVVYPWQVIGLWRAADRYTVETRKIVWPGLAKLFVAIGLLGGIGSFYSSWPVLKQVYQTGFTEDEFGDYQIEVVHDGSLIHLKGGFGFGLSGEVKRLLEKSPNVKGIILDSGGGRIYESREISEIILVNNLDTYTLTGCNSACASAFLSGSKRYLADGANIGFHQYKSNVDVYIDIDAEQERDAEAFRRRGIAPEFIAKIFTAKQDDLWYPTLDELLTSGAVSAIVAPSTMQPIQYGSVSAGDIEDELKSFSAFASIKKYDSATYQQLIAEIEAQLKNGASVLEIQHAVANRIGAIAGVSLTMASDRTLIAFTSQFIHAMRKLERIQPMLCMKLILPDQYGSIDYGRYFSIEDMMPLMEALNLVIVDSYTSEAPDVDVSAAEELVAQIRAELGDDAVYLDMQRLNNSEDYSNACNTVIRIYESVLSKDDIIAANGMRYLVKQ